MNLDAVREFVKAIDLLPANYRVRMLVGGQRTVQESGHLPRANQYGWVSREEAQKLIREADVLFLPLSFKNCSAEEVRTVFSTKTLDYLVVGRADPGIRPPRQLSLSERERKGLGIRGGRRRSRVAGPRTANIG